MTQDAKARLQASSSLIGSQSSMRLEMSCVLSQRQQGVEKEDQGMLETIGFLVAQGLVLGEECD